jgi:hypothetical protein
VTDIGPLAAPASPEPEGDQDDLPPPQDRVFMALGFLAECFKVVAPAIGISAVFDATGATRVVVPVAFFSAVPLLHWLGNRLTAAGKSPRSISEHGRSPLPVTLLVAQGGSAALFVATPVLLGVAPGLTNVAAPILIFVLLAAGLLAELRLSVQLWRVDWRPSDADLGDRRSEVVLAWCFNGAAFCFLWSSPAERSVTAFVALSCGIWAAERLNAMRRVRQDRRGQSGSTFGDRILRAGGVLILVSVLAAGADVAIAAAEIATQHPSSEIASPAVPARPAVDPGPKQLLPSTQPSAPAVQPIAPVLPGFTILCGSSSDALPGATVPSSADWARMELYNLWLGSGVGVGGSVAGCPAPAQFVDDGTDQVWYQAGFGNGVLQSVGVASRRYGSAIFLDGGVAQYVLNELESGLAVAGSQRASIGHGDAQLIFSSRGTTAFVRATKHATGSPDEATPLTVVPLAAFNLWTEAMVAHQEWLWPRYVSGSDSAGGVIGLSSQSFGPPIATISLTPGGTDASLRSAAANATAEANGSIVPWSEIARFGSR